MRKFLLISSVVLLAVGAGLFGYGSYLNTDMSVIGANIGAGVMALLGILVAAIGVCLVLVWAVTKLVMSRKTSTHHAR